MSNPKNEFPMALFNASGNSRVVKTQEEFDALDPKEWRDSPAAFEKHPNYADYKKSNP